MSKEDLKVKPVEQEVTKEDLKKVSGGDNGCFHLLCPPVCEEEGGESAS